jgi:nuclear control of ATPase protein 2
MVAEFGRDHYHFTEEQVAQLSSQVREGDLSSVLKAYEEAIKVSDLQVERHMLHTLSHTTPPLFSQSPVKNALRGDLIRTLLIQVQKTKVDVDLAMAALDKLLKSNELNFAFLGNV